MKIITLIVSLLFSQWCFGQTQHTLAKDSLPIKIREKIEHKYKDYSITNIGKETTAGSEPVYKLRASKEKAVNGKSTVTIYDLTFNAEGKLLSENKRKETFYTGSLPPKPSRGHSKNDGHNH